MAEVLKEAPWTDGIDQQSPETAIKEGFCEDLENVDPLPEGYLRTRNGFETYAGQLPIRVSKVTYTTEATENCKLKLVGGGNTFPLTSTPLVISGRTSVAGNPSNLGSFPNTSAGATVWFSKFITPGISYQTGNGTKTMQPTGAWVHWAGVARSTSYTDDSNEWVVPETDSQNGTTYVTSLTIDSYAPSAVYAMWLVSMQASAGDVYQTTQSVASSDTPQTITITAATHGLTGVDMLCRVFHSTGGNLVRIVPELFKVQSDGTVVVQIRQVTGSPQDYVISLKKADVLDTVIGTATSLVAEDVESPFAMWQIFELQGTDWVEVQPDSVTYNDATRSFSVGIVSSSVAAFKWVAVYIDIVTDEIIVDASVIGAPFTDTAPELFVYGINYRDMDLTLPVTYLDAYRDAIGETPVASIKGNLFSVADPSKSSTVALSSLMDGAGSGQFYIGPVFSKLVSNRLTGYVQADIVSTSGMCPLISYTKASGNNCDVKLRIPSYVVSGSPFNVDVDYVTISGCLNSKFNGEFLLKAVSYPDADHITLTIENADIESDVQDDPGNGEYHLGFAGIFCDVIPTTTSTPAFIPGDVLTSSAFSAEKLIVCTGTDGSDVFVKGVSEEILCPNIEPIYGTRVTDLVPIQDNQKFVKHDTVAIGSNEAYSVLSETFPQNTLNCTTCTGDGIEATLTLTGDKSAWFYIGQKILVNGMSAHSGVHTLTDLSYDGVNTKLYWESTITTSVTASGRVVSPTIQLEKEVTITHADDVICPYRWTVQKPTANTGSYTRIAENSSLIYSTDVDENLRGVMLNDILYTVSEDNKPKAYDGFETRDVGLPAWNPIASLQVETATGISIPVNSITATAYAGGTFTVTSGDEKRYRARYVTADQTVIPGELIQVFNGSTWEATCEVVDNTRAGFLYTVAIRGTPTSGTRTLKLCRTCSYYARLRATDSQDNIILGPTCGRGETKVELVDGASSVKLTLMEPPGLGSWPYDRGVFIDLFRTKTNEDGGLYYKIATLACAFTASQPYQQYIDVSSDDLLIDLDSETTAARGSLTESIGEGASIDRPLRAKCLTSLDNSLIMGNIKGTPRYKFSILKNQALAASNFNSATVTFAGLVFEWISSTVTITASSRSGSTVTLSATGTYTTGDWVYVSSTPRTSSNPTGPCGWFRVVTGGTGSLTITYGSGTATFTNGFLCVATLRTSIPVYTGADTAFGDQLGAGGSSVTVDANYLCMRRMGIAMQAVIAYMGYSDYNVKVGREWGVGVIELYGLSSSTVTVTGGTFDFALNDVKKSKSTAYTFQTNLYPSRLLISPTNYGEVMFNPEGEANSAAAESFSVLEVNPSDGDEIVSIIPFFGESAFGAAQQSGVIACFKHRAIYIVDIAQFKAGRISVQRLDARGLGCDGGQSPCYTREGIIFTNRFGIFKLKKDLTVEWTGRILDRYWKENVTTAQAVAAFGHTCSPDQHQRIAVGDNVFVYNPTREAVGGAGNGIGSWTRYTGLGAVCFTNAERQTLFGTSSGEVKRVTRYDDKTLNYYDDGTEVASTITFRASDFGTLARKEIKNVFMTFRNSVSATVNLTYAADLDTNFASLAPVTLSGETASDGLTTKTSRKCDTFRYKLSSKCQYFQLKLTASGLCEVAGLSYEVEGLNTKGTKEASD